MDDDPDVLRATGHILQEAGFTVFTGSRAAEVVELTRRHHPTLLLLDVVLADGNGVDVARLVKSDPTLADVFVILVSGTRTSADSQAAGLDEGLADGYIVRPFNKNEFLARIEAFLRLWETQEQLREKNAKLEQLREVLLESEHKYHNIFQSSRDAMMIVEPPSWKFTDGNPAMVEMFRLKNAQELTTLGLWDIFPERQPDGRASGEKGKEMIETAVREGSHSFEWTHKRIDGQEFPATVLLTRMEQAGKVFVQGTVRDITVQKQVEEERKKLLVRRQGINLLQQSLLEPTPLEEKLRRVTDGIVRLFDADFCRIWLIRPGDLCQGECIHAAAEDGPHVCRYRDRCLHLLASSGRYTHIDGQTHRRVPYDCYKIGRVASGEDHKFLTNDAQNDPNVHNHQWARELGLISFAGYQIRVPDGETLGVLGLFAKHPIDESEDAMLDGLSMPSPLLSSKPRCRNRCGRRKTTRRTLSAQWPTCSWSSRPMAQSPRSTRQPAICWVIQNPS